MTASLSADLRLRVISAISGGLSSRKAAARFEVGISTAGAWFRRYRDRGEVAAREQGQPPGSKLDAHEAFILGLVEEAPDITLVEIAARLVTDHRVSACPATLCAFFKARDITFKKRRRMRASNNAAM